MDKSVCAICSDFLTCGNCFACPCGHTFHSLCINTWKKNSSTCPQCRAKFKDTIKIFFELSREDKDEGDPAELRNELTELKLKLRVKDTSIETLTKEKKTVTQESKSKEQELKAQQHLLESALGTNDALKKQLTYMEKFKNDVKRAKNDVVALQKKMESYRNIQQLIDVESHDVETTLKSFADSPDSFNQISTSYVVLKKEFDRLKESKRIVENEKKSYRKKAESSARETCEIREQLKIVTNDLKQLDEQNKSLSQRVVKLKQSRSSNNSPTSSASKRSLCESPEAKDLKRQCVTDTEEGHVEEVAEDSLVLFDDVYCRDTNSGCNYEDDGQNYEGETQDLDLDEEETIKIADEFGLHYIATTSVGSERKPLKDLTKNMNSFASKQKQTGTNHNLKLHVNHRENYDLPHFKRGFNGMGGQSKTLVIPNRKPPSFVKPSTDKKVKLGFTKIPKNNMKITKFVTQRSASTVDLT